VLFWKRVGWGQFHQHVYVQLLRALILKAQKDNQVISVVLCFWVRRSRNRKKNVLTGFFALSGSARIKSARRLLVKSTPDFFFLVFRTMDDKIMDEKWMRKVHFNVRQFFRVAILSNWFGHFVDFLAKLLNFAFFKDIYSSCKNMQT